MRKKGDGIISLVGKTYSRLTVVRISGRKCGKITWLCKCVCGNEKVVFGNHLNTGMIKSCGCLQIENRTTHGETKTKFYRVWRQIKIRTKSENSNKFPRYAGRGITMCERWGKFENFKSDMFSTYMPGLLIDRKDNNGNYSPENCRWVTRTVSDNNKSNTRRIKINGQTKLISEWAKESNISVSTLGYRLYNNCPESKLLNPPGISWK